MPRLILAGSLFALCISPMTLSGAREKTLVRSVWEGVYTIGQAARGKEIFERECAVCHSAKPGASAGDGSVPSLIGADFHYRWADSSIAYLIDTIRQTMPEAAPNTLSLQEYTLVTTYLLELNGYPAGTLELDATNRKGLEQIFIQQM